MISKHLKPSNIIKIYNIHSVKVHKSFFTTLSEDFSNLRRKIQEDELDLTKLNSSQIRDLSEQVSVGFRGQQIERSLVEKFSNIVCDYMQRDPPECKKFTLDDYYSLLNYNYFTRSDKYISILTASICNLLEENYKDAEEVPEVELQKAIHLVSRLNKLGVYNSQLFTFVSRYVNKLNDRLLSDFASLSQKYGLRTKHILDVCYKESLKRIENIDLDLSLNLLRSFSFFSYEYREIYFKSVDKILENVNSLSNEDALLMLNVAKTLNNYPDMMNMRDQILARIEENILVMPNTHLIKCVGELYRGSRSRIAKTFVSSVLDKVEEDDLKNLTINSLVNLLHTINHFKTKLTYLTDILRILGSRMNEVVSNRNLGLWADIFTIILDCGWLSLPFMKAAIKNIIMEPQVLCRVSTYQLVKVLQTFYKLRIYHEESYKALIDAIENGFDTLLPKLNMVSETILAAADGNIERNELFTKSFDFITKRVKELDLMNSGEELLTEMSNNYIWPRNIITSAWSFTVMDFHKREEFKTLMELLLHPRFHNEDVDLNLILMCLEVAETCLVDGVHIDLAQDVSETYGDKMRFKEINREEPEELENLKDNRLSFTESQNIHFHKGRTRATRHIQTILDNLNKKDVLLRVAPHYNSPYIVDVCFSKENKKGIILFSGRELLRNHIDGKWTNNDTGSTKLKLKILKRQNWNVVALSCSQWSHLSSGLERREYIKSLMDQLNISY
ncbi:hypothetical protein MACK_004066 [Theileria orientalis]|uniref:RAP domain-containing protein n=1 Tax=Theileria orientalis TaxID=68886 RepID=A0A976SJY0_THEOR|nr:hypothetical protein MACK_004066 [Theileria orientalis]